MAQVVSQWFLYELTNHKRFRGLSLSFNSEKYTIKWLSKLAEMIIIDPNNSQFLNKFYSLFYYNNNHIYKWNW